MVKAVKGVFVAGTDTGVGKTLVATLLLRAFGTRGWRTAAMKPVAATMAIRTRNGNACPMPCCMAWLALSERSRPKASI